MSTAVSPAHADALRAHSENKIVVVQIDDRLNGQLASAPENARVKRDYRYDDTVVGVSALANFLFTREHRDFWPDYAYVFVEPPARADRCLFRDADGHRCLSPFWGKVYALALCMRAMPTARWFLVLDTDAFLGVTGASRQLAQYIQLAERTNRHVLLQACRTEGEEECPDFWGNILGMITPPVYAEPMAFNSGAILVRQSPEGRAFINTWIGLTGESMGPSPLEQRFTTMEVSVELDGIETSKAGDKLARDVVASAISKAHTLGAPVLQEHEQAYIASVPTGFNDIDPSKTRPSATMTEKQLRFNLRSVSGNQPLWELAEWITQGGCAGVFARILRDSLGQRQTARSPVVKAISSRIIQDRCGEYLIEWPGDQERLSWAYSLLSQHVLVIPWNNDPTALCFQYIDHNQQPLTPSDTVLDWCPAPIWHPCLGNDTKLEARDWVSSLLASRYTEKELSIRLPPVLKPYWGDIETGGESCTLETLLARIDKGKFELWL